MLKTLTASSGPIGSAAGLSKTWEESSAAAGALSAVILNVCNGCASADPCVSVCRKHSGAYSGGCVKVSPDGASLACLYNGDVSFLDISSGQVLRSLLKVDGQDDDDTEEDDAEGREEIVCFALRPNGTEIVTASRNLLLRHWEIGQVKCKRTIRAHEQVVLSMDYD
eukprot:6095-Heterococcus_DN1.PRE.2